MLAPGLGHQSMLERVFLPLEGLLERHLWWVGVLVGVALASRDGNWWYVRDDRGVSVVTGVSPS